MSFGPYLAPYTKINLKWIIGLNGNPKTIEIIAGNIFYLVLKKDYLNMTPETQSKKNTFIDYTSSK